MSHVLASHGSLATAAALLCCAAASAGITIAQTEAPAPTYATTLTFDEPGTPTGSVPSNAFASTGLAVLESGTGVNTVGDVTGFLPWVGSGNSFYGPFGVFMTFSNDLTEFSTQAWDPSGPPSPFGGGMGVYVFNDGIEVASAFVTPAWGGVGKSWFNVTTTDGSVFDEVRILGFGFPYETYVDNLSWNAVPGPGGLALLGLAFARRSRRRPSN